MANEIELIEGHTQSIVLRLEVPPIVRVPIQSITSPLGQAHIVCQSAHNLKDGWRVAITNAKGNPKVNADLDMLAKPDNKSEYHAATVTSLTELDLNEFNIADLGTHTAGTGFLQYNTPATMTGYTFRLRLRDRKGGKLLVCTHAGTSGTTKPTGAGTDGGVTWAAGSSSLAEKVWVAGTVYAQGDVVDLSVIASSELIDAPLNTLTIVPNATTSTILITFTAAFTIANAGKVCYGDIEMVETATGSPVPPYMPITVKVGKE